METIMNEINARLEEIITTTINKGPVADAMLYSVMAGGKRLRPLLLIKTLSCFGIDYHPYLDIACAIEMIHTYSLIHDDLPGMDNDDLRRGKPTCHKQFDEATAILAGDALLNESMNVILRCEIDEHKKFEILKLLYNASGMNGMIYGQQQDMYYENHQATLEELKDIHKYKTGCLLSAPFEIGGIIANKDRDALRTLGFTLGLAFQIQDDILDVTSDTETLGKPVGSDEKNHKSTYVSLLGLDKARDYEEELFHECIDQVSGIRFDHDMMVEMIKKVMKRVN